MSWLVAAPLSELEREGDAVPFDHAHERLLVVRGPGGLGAFFNVCQHRGHPLLNEACRLRSLRCGYHGWRYDLEGELVHVPDREAFDDLEGIRLPRLEVCAVDPFVWVRLGEGERPTAFDGLRGLVVRERIVALVGRSEPTLANLRIDLRDDALVARLEPHGEGMRATIWRLANDEFANDEFAGEDIACEEALARLGLRPL